MKRIALVGLFVLFLIVAWQSGMRIYAGRQVSIEVAELMENVVALQQQNSALFKLLQYVKSPAFAEREARLRFGMARPGEQEVVIVPPRGTQPPQSPAGDAKERVSNSWLWWKYFVGE